MLALGFGFQFGFPRVKVRVRVRIRVRVVLRVTLLKHEQELRQVDRVRGGARIDRRVGRRVPCKRDGG